jgi:hypothetical protein
LEKLSWNRIYIHTPSFVMEKIRLKKWL